MQDNTLAFFIGIQNLCLTHNRLITSLQWVLGNALIVVCIILSILLFYALKGKVVSKWVNRCTVGFWVFLGIFFLGYNVVSLSMPIDERDAMEDVLKKKPEIAQTVTHDFEKLKAIGADFK